MHAGWPLTWEQMPYLCRQRALISFNLQYCNMYMRRHETLLLGLLDKLLLLCLGIDSMSTVCTSGSECQA